MKKKNFKKIAMMGVTGGMMIAAQTPVQGEAHEGTTIAAHACGGGCGGKTNYRGGSSCGGKSSCANKTNSNYYYNTADADMEMQQQYNQQQDSSSVRMISESELLSKLSPEGKSIYNGLSPEGKALALKLASQDSFRDKNMAVKEALKRLSEKRNQMNNGRY